MNANVELLNFIYQNSEMGVNTLDQLLGIVEDTNFKDQIKSQYQEYKTIHEKARELLIANGHEEKDIGLFAKIRTYLMINIQTLTDKSASHIAEMLIIGSNMGIIDAVKNLNKYRGEAEKDIVDLMDRLLTFEEVNVKTLRNYL